MGFPCGRVLAAGQEDGGGLEGRTCAFSCAVYIVFVFGLGLVCRSVGVKVFGWVSFSGCGFADGGEASDILCICGIGAGFGRRENGNVKAL